MRILLASHSWSFAQPGGAEHSAQNLAQALRHLGHEVRLVSCTPNLDQDLGYDSVSGTTLIRSATAPGTFLWTEPRVASFWRRLIDDFKPDVLHLHHYINVGAELPLLCNRVRPECAVVLTLHEYAAICPRDGQMLDMGGRLCESSGVRKCAACTGSMANTLALKDATLRALFRHVDTFISPSRFLRDRYVAWGLPEDRVEVLPNVLTSTEARDRSTRKADHAQLVFMSQHTPYKGLDVLLRALRILERSHPALTERCSVDIWGDGIERFGAEWTQRIEELGQGLSEWVSFRGAYAPEQLETIYGGADWTLVPSVWWENRPLVIEESLSRGVPVITSNIGGMAELVHDDSFGLTCPPNDPHALALTIVRAIEEPKRSPRYHAEVTAQPHLALYERVLTARQAAPQARRT